MHAKRDDIQPIELMIYTTLRAVMICHYSVMDKKMTAILYQNYSHFLERETGFGPATFALARQRSTTEPLPHNFL